MYPGNEKIKETKQSCCWSPVLALQAPPAYDVEQDICMMTPFDYKDQNPSGFACLILIDLFTDTAAILISIVSNCHYGMHIAPGHPIMTIRNNRNQNGRRIGKRVY